jgi:hypothetical protein
VAELSAVPPCPQPYPQPVPVPAAGFRNPQGLAVALTALLSVCLVADVLALASAGYLWSLLPGVADGAYSWEQADAVHDAAVVLNRILLAFTFCLLATGVVFLMWLFRVRNNIELFVPGADRLWRGWAIAGWFVPLWNLWAPFEIMRDTWRDSTPVGGNSRTYLVGAWWLTFMGASVLLQVAAEFGDTETGPVLDSDRWQDTAMLGTLGGAFGTVATILAIVLVRRLTARQLARYAQGPQPYPYPGPPVAAQPPMYASPVTPVDRPADDREEAGS